MGKMIEELQDIVGKTVAGVDNRHAYGVLIAFECGDYLYLMGDEYEGDVEIEASVVEPNDEAKVAVGLMTREQARANQEATIARRILEREVLRRKQYEELKQEFGNAVD